MYAWRDGTHGHTVIQAATNDTSTTHSFVIPGLLTALRVHYTGTRDAATNIWTMTLDVHDGAGALIATETRTITPWYAPYPVSSGVQIYMDYQTSTGPVDGSVLIEAISFHLSP